ncbi:MAG: acyl--CoA ligase, partial [Pirellulales bacterium]|nr:acyl--CoA ligase [Pirellulales bacterium]
MLADGKEMQAPGSRTAFELLQEQATRHPDRPAVLTLDAEVSYRELADRALSVAGSLAARGLRRGDRLGLLSDNRLAWLELFFGASRCGICIAPFSTWSTLAELEFLIRDSEISTLYSLERYGDRTFVDGVRDMAVAGKLPKLDSVVAIDEPHLPGSGPPDVAAEPDDWLTLLYTSGSSSRPKSVPLQHFAAIENGFNIGERLGLTEADRVLVSIPLFWSYGAVNALMATISHGAALVLQPRFEAGGALDLIESRRCTAIYTLPAMTNALLAHPAFASERTASLRTGATIGAPQDVMRAAEELGARSICNIY